MYWKCINIIMVTALIVGCFSGCGQNAEVTLDEAVLGAPVSIMTEEAVLDENTEIMVAEEEVPMQESTTEQEIQEKEIEEIVSQEIQVELIEKKKRDIKTLTAADIVKDMKIGWCLGNTMDSVRDDLAITEPAYRFETGWGNTETTQELIDAVIAQGFNAIRIPVTWKNHIGKAPEYKIEDSWMQRVKEIVDYAYNRGVYVIINTHHEDWNYTYYDNEEAAAEKMRIVWTQIAEVFQDYDEYLIFEAQNEPRKVGSSVEWTGGDKEGWEVVNSLNQVFIDTIRQSGGSNPYRILIIPSYAANAWKSAYYLDIPENDNRVIVSVHAYEPYDFALNMGGRSEWKQDTYAIDTILGNIKTLFVDKNIPVIMGEFGAMNRNNEDERAEWAYYYVSKAKEIGVPCFWWDNGLFEGDGERFGLFDRKTYECVYPKLLEALQKATQE